MNQFNIGDRVSPLDEDWKGNIISFKTDYIAVVEDDNGFRHNIPCQNLIQYPHENLLDNAPIFNKEISKLNKSKKKNLISRIDLHKEKLPEKYISRLHPTILSSQEHYLKEILQFHEKQGTQRLQIIHGIGDGILQKVILNVIRSSSYWEAEEQDFFYHELGLIEIKRRKF